MSQEGPQDQTLAEKPKQLSELEQAEVILSEGIVRLMKLGVDVRVPGVQDSEGKYHITLVGARAWIEPLAPGATSGKFKIELLLNQKPPV